MPDRAGPGHAMTWLPGEAGDKYFRSNLPAVLAELGGRYELVWATAWENHANLILAPALGLPSLPVVRFSDPAPGEVGHAWAGRTWKLPSVQRFAGQRSLAWVDDDLHADAYAWAALWRIPAKLIRTDPRPGADGRPHPLAAGLRRPLNDESTRHRSCSRPENQQRDRRGRHEVPVASKVQDRRAPLTAPRRGFRKPNVSRNDGARIGRRGGHGVEASQ